LTFTDASQDLGLVAIFVGFKEGSVCFLANFFCMGTSKLLPGLAVPKAEMKAAVDRATSP
jgi:hypothetical protein